MKKYGKRRVYLGEVGDMEGKEGRRIGRKKRRESAHGFKMCAEVPLHDLAPAPRLGGNDLRSSDFL